MSARCNRCYTFHLRLPFNIFHSNIPGFSILATILYYSLWADKDQSPARIAGPVYSSRLAHPCAFAHSRPRPHPPHPSRKGRQAGEARACTCASVLIHLAPLTGRGGLRHRSSPPGRCDRRWHCVLSVWDIFRHVSSLWFKCFRCFRRIFQMFHLDVAYITMAIHACFKRVFQMFQMFSDLCCKCFIWILQK
jgi:hypothetical protein